MCVGNKRRDPLSDASGRSALQRDAVLFCETGQRHKAKALPEQNERMRSSVAGGQGAEGFSHEGTARWRTLKSYTSCARERIPSVYRGGADKFTAARVRYLYNSQFRRYEARWSSAKWEKSPRSGRRRSWHKKLRRYIQRWRQQRCAECAVENFRLAPLTI